MQQRFFMGTLLLFAGFLLSYACPLNKRLWSPSFVLVTCGIAALALAVLIEVIDVRKKKEWCTFFKHTKGPLQGTYIQPEPIQIVRPLLARGSNSAMTTAPSPPCARSIPPVRLRHSFKSA